MPTKHRIFTTPVANVYPYYIAKAERKGRTKAEVDTIFCWLTGYTLKQLPKKMEQDFETFFKKAELRGQDAYSEVIGDRLNGAEPAGRVVVLGFKELSSASTGCRLTFFRDAP